MTEGLMEMNSSSSLMGKDNYMRKRNGFNLVRVTQIFKGDILVICLNEKGYFGQKI